MSYNKMIKSRLRFSDPCRSYTTANRTERKAKARKLLSIIEAIKAERS